MAETVFRGLGVLGRVLRSPSGACGMFLLSCVVVLAVAAPWLYPDGPFEMVGAPFSPPFDEFPLGTDMLGRDIAAGIAYGARISLVVGAVATLFITVLGTVIGGTAGYYGGSIDSAVMRITEFFQTIPTFIGAIVIVVTIGIVLVLSEIVPLLLPHSAAGGRAAAPPPTSPAAPTERQRSIWHTNRPHAVRPSPRRPSHPVASNGHHLRTTGAEPL